MKNLFKSIVLFKLNILAKIRLKRMGAKVIGITGTVGKTTTKDAIVHILKQKYKVRYSETGYNTEFGVPLMILGLKSPHSSFIGWIKVLFQGISKAFEKEKFDFVIAEMGVDKRGDMKQLLRLLRPQIAIFIQVARMHTAEGQFENEEDILNEKMKIFSKQKKHDIAIINIDDERIRRIKGKLHSSVITYGTRNEADVKIKNLAQSKDVIRFSAEFKRHSAQFNVPILGKHFVTCLAPAIVTAAIEGFTMNEIAESLTTFELPRGRMNVIPGKKDSLIIDSSYNASPVAVEAALRLMNEIPSARRICALGQMNELGQSSIAEHKKIGQLVPGACDLLVTVHGHAKYISDEAIKGGMSKSKVHHFKNSTEAGIYLAKELKKDDLVLVKGSQNNVLMERLVMEIMKNKKDAPKLLVRQEKEWRKK